MNESHERKRLLDLLADQATEGLAASEQAELAALLVRYPDIESQSMERAAALLAVATTSTGSMPRSLEQRLEADADRFVSPPRAASNLIHGLGWLVAAASLALALILWMNALPNAVPPTAQRSLPPESAVPEDQHPPPVLVADTEIGNELPHPIEDAPDAMVLRWRPSKELKPVSGLSGEVVWSTAAQRGELRFRGLPRNDPTKVQYQLWILDRDRASEYPVSGGVFDVEEEAADGQVVMYIQPSLPISQPTGFALTREKPGGVVVSDSDYVFIATEPEQSQESE